MSKCDDDVKSKHNSETAIETTEEYLRLLKLIKIFVKVDRRTRKEGLNGK